MLVRVEGGTGAGRRMHRRTTPATSWVCAHAHLNSGYATTCLTSGCGQKRPKER